MNFIKSKTYTLETNQSIDYIREAFNLKIKETNGKRGLKPLFLFPDYSSISVLKEKIIIDDVPGGRVNRDARIGRIVVYLSPLENGTCILAKTEPYESQIILPLAGFLFCLLCSVPVLKFNCHVSNLHILATVIVELGLLLCLVSIAALTLKNQMKSYQKSVFWHIHIDPHFKEIKSEPHL